MDLHFRKWISDHMRRSARFGTMCKILKTWKHQRKSATFTLKVILLHRCFSRFLKCKIGTKSSKASHIMVRVLKQQVSQTFLLLHTCTAHGILVFKQVFACQVGKSIDFFGESSRKLVENLTLTFTGFYPSSFVYSQFPPKIQFLYFLLNSMAP